MTSDFKPKLPEQGEKCVWHFTNTSRDDPHRAEPHRGATLGELHRPGLSFRYRLKPGEKSDPPASITLSLMLDKTPAVSWTFLNDGNPEPDVALLRKNLASLQLRLGPGADSLAQKRGESGEGANGRGGEVHTARPVFRDGKVEVAIDGEVRIPAQPGEVTWQKRSARISPQNDFKGLVAQNGMLVTVLEFPTACRSVSP